MDDLVLNPTPDGVTIPVRVVPRAGRTALDGVVEGAANRALVEFLAELLGVPKRDITIVRGERGRQKLVQVRGLTPTELRRRLAAPD